MCIAGIALSVLVGCATAGTTKKPVQQTELLDWKGAGLGNPVPEWVMIANDGSAVNLEALPEYKDQYCFAVSNRGQDLPFLQEWTKRVEGQTEIANFVSTTVTDNVQSEMRNKEGIDPDADIRAVSDVASSFANASYTGARRVADFWILSRNRATKDEYYQAFALFIVDKAILNTQIAQNLENIITKNQELSAAEIEIYRSLIAKIQSRGLLN
ncbi:hypothetical protein FACS189462_1190 [Spirochaetia bacterium]|nr:hypothetical protein FACS189462_1190 [Spirochaetia bacterium]